MPIKPYQISNQRLEKKHVRRQTAESRTSANGHRSFSRHFEDVASKIPKNHASNCENKAPRLIGPAKSPSKVGHSGSESNICRRAKTSFPMLIAFSMPRLWYTRSRNFAKTKGNKSRGEAGTILGGAQHNRQEYHQSQDQR